MLRNTENCHHHLQAFKAQFSIGYASYKVATKQRASFMYSESLSACLCTKEGILIGLFYEMANSTERHLKYFEDCGETKFWEFVVK